MAFNCSILLSDIDINCNKKVTGGIKKAILLLQKDITITFSPTDETLVTQVDTLNTVSNPRTESVTGYKIIRDNTAVTMKPLYSAFIMFLVLPSLTKKVPAIEVRMHDPPIASG